MNESKQIIRGKLTALVTGATGFIGSRLVCRLVREGWQVHIVTRAHSRLPKTAELEKVKVHIHDGSTDSIVSCVGQARPDVVFHLASSFISQHTTKDVNSLIESNVLFGSQLLEAMKINKITNLVNTGTSWQHYDNDDYNPVCLYAATKQAYEAILEYYRQACDCNVITLKLFDTYGPGDSRSKLFNLLNTSLINCERLDMSGGEQLIDLVHVEDVVEAYCKAAQRLIDRKVQHHERYAVSSGHPLPLRDLVEMYIKTTGCAIHVNWGGKPYRFREVMKTWTKGESIEGWYPKIGLTEGIKSLQTKSNSF